MVLVVAGYYLGYRAWAGVYAIGSDPDAARLAGVPVRRRVFAAFVLSGALAGLARCALRARHATTPRPVWT